MDDMASVTYAFFLFQSFKKVKAILKSQGTQKQVMDQIWPRLRRQP